MWKIFEGLSADRLVKSTKLNKLDLLKSKITKCTICASDLELGPRPVFAFDITSRILIIGQAPGSIVHKSGIPWNDKSGENLRRWMGITKETFYDESKIAIVPMGFCYPGKGKSGDLPPRKECAPEWHTEILPHLKELKLILLIGKYAQDYYLGKSAKRTLTDTVKNYHEYLPKYMALPHPSPRNNIWMKKNSWFGKEVLPQLKEIVFEAIK